MAWKRRLSARFRPQKRRATANDFEDINDKISTVYLIYDLMTSVPGL